MKKIVLYCSAVMFVYGITGCTGTTTSTNTSDTTSNTQMNGNDSAVTTNTTTTVVHHRYSGSFVPQATTKYLDLQTNKRVTVRVDTVRGIVNTETDQPVDLLVEPTTHDTIYGQTGSVVNNYIIKDNGTYRVDTVRINNTDTVVVPSGTSGKEKIKDKGNKEKIKEKP